LSEVKAEDLARKIRVEIEHRSRPLDAVLRDVYLATERHREIRVRPSSAEAAGDAAYVIRAPHAPELAPGPERLHAERSRRFSEFHAKAASETDARFAALGFEAWAMGSQLVAVTLPKKQG
jgi:hypothetical protein